MAANFNSVALQLEAMRKGPSGQSWMEWNNYPNFCSITRS